MEIPSPIPFSPEHTTQEAAQVVEPEKGHFWGRKALGLALLVGSVGALAFEQSPANEALRINRGTAVMKGGGSPIDVALTVAELTAEIELGASALVIAGLNQEGGAMNNWVEGSRSRKARRTLARQQRKEMKKAQKIDMMPAAPVYSAEVDENELDSEPPVTEEAIITPESAKSNRLLKAASSTLEFVGVSLGVGSSIVVVDKRLSSEKPSLSKDIGYALGSTAVTSGVVGGIGYLVAGGKDLLAGTPFEGPAQFVVDYATNFKVWMLILSPILATRGVRWASDVWHEAKDNKSNSLVEG